MSLQPHLLNAVAGGLAIFLLGIAFHGKKKLHGTTLAAPCLWVAISALCLAVLAVTQVFRSNEDQTIGMSAMRFAVAASTLCPVIAVLGAKRPQDHGWQWVVFTLWLIVVWPAAQAVLKPVGPRLEIFMLWKIFIVALISLGLLNYVPTRHALANVFVVSGQFVMFSEFLGLPQPTGWLPLAVAWFLGGAVFVHFMSSVSLPKSAILPEQTARWLWFRDAFGAFWGLRIMQRVNETAVSRNWPVQLTWTGFEKVKDEELIEAQAAEIDLSLDTLLRRFL